ncbi:hypothetical protein ATANTOWER_025734 [Ataeniobius toweri]|uniref:Uncharacterized protein n=1 Tax=Ataeniobius toweri TaxID=208326 RepID=A0ABU7A3H7_9TELE|nr:hypothetical protein [Ataeniobius toweri]
MLQTTKKSYTITFFLSDVIECFSRMLVPLLIQSYPELREDISSSHLLNHTNMLHRLSYNPFNFETHSSRVDYFISNCTGAFINHIALSSFTPNQFAVCAVSAFMTIHLNQANTRGTV